MEAHLLFSFKIGDETNKPKNELVELIPTQPQRQQHIIMEHYRNTGNWSSNQSLNKSSIDLEFNSVTGTSLTKLSEASS
jgi:hypothetical protein